MQTRIIEIIEKAMVGKVLFIDNVWYGRIQKVDFYGYGDLSLGVTTTKGIASVQPYDHITLLDKESGE